MIYLRKYNNIKLTEDVNDIDNDTQDIVDADLQAKKAQLLKQKSDKKAQFEKEMQRIDDQILQLYNQQTIKNKQKTNQIKNNNQQTNQQNESVKFNNKNKLFEGRNRKQELLNIAIKNIFNNIESSYVLTELEINRLSRKINDTLNYNKNNKNVWEIVKYEIKKYLLNHNRISLSQSEINNLINLLESELQKNEYKTFSYLFDNQTKSLTINILDDTNVDELEAELNNLNFNIEEDLNNNKLILTNINNFNLKMLKDILKEYNLLKNNYDMFF